MESKIDKILERLHEIDITLVRNTDSLELHMKRTALIEKQMEPIKEHVQLMNNIAKIIVFIGVLLGIFSKVFNG